MAATIPNGTLISAAIPTMISVPRMALPKPPPCSMAAGGSDVKTERLSLWIPRTRSMYTTENSGTNASQRQQGGQRGQQDADDRPRPAERPFQLAQRESLARLACGFDRSIANHQVFHR